MYRLLRVNNNANRSRHFYFKYFFIFLCLVLVYFVFFFSYESSSLSEIDKFVLKTDKRYKKILFWNQFFETPDYGFGLGTKPFRDHNCKVQECLLVYDSLKRSVEDYDAVVFHGPEYHPILPFNYPTNRKPSQRFIYLSMESPEMHPISSRVNDFYNWTATYRLDSDLLMMYFGFYDIKTGERVSHKENPKWKKKTIISKSLMERKAILETKRKPVAWFVSNCYSKNNREGVAEEIQKYIDVDIYGRCGPLKCLRSHADSCTNMLKRDYYFYFTFENSNCVDYITEKQAKAFENYVIPIFYGGANLTRFLPPHSYIDARDMTAKELADKLHFLMDHPLEYLAYFWWKDFYFIDSQHIVEQPFCKLCEMLHDESLPSKAYGDIFNWWNTGVCNKITS